MESSGPHQHRIQSTINCIDLYPVFVPFSQPVRQTMQGAAGGLGMALDIDRPWLGGDFVLCRLTAQDGAVGWGEVFVWLPETGVTSEQILAIVRSDLAWYVLGKNPFDVNEIRRAMDRNIARNEVAKGLLDMACYDLMGRLANRPARDMMGRSDVDEVDLCALVPLSDPEVMTGLARGFVEAGFKTLRIKLGLGPTEDEVIIRAVRQAVGQAVRLRVDYNQAYEPRTAVEAIRRIEFAGIDYAEQPVRADDFIGMAYVQARLDTPLMAHEGCFSLAEIQTLAHMDAIRVIGLNTERPGGVTHMLRALDLAEKLGLDAVLHNQSLGVGTAVHLHLAAARHHQLAHATEAFGGVMFENDLLPRPIHVQAGRAQVPAGPGWGVEPDHNAIENYTQAPPIRIETGR